MILPIGDIQRPDKTPFVNYAFLAANIVVYLFFQPNEFSHFDGFGKFLEEWGFTPSLFIPITLLSSMFLHGDLYHLLGNMLFLWITGDNIEGRLGHIGYFIFYLTAGLAATMAHYVSDMTSAIPSLGASGAISGVLGAYFILCAKNKIKVFYWIWFYIGVILVPARLAIGFWILQQVILAMVVTSGAETGIAVWAHIGGIVFGLAIIFLLVKSKLVTRETISVQYKSYRRRPTEMFRRKNAAFSAWESPYATYSRQRNLFGQEPAPQPASTPGPPTAIPIGGESAGYYSVITLKPWKNNSENVVDAVATFRGLPFSTISRDLRDRSGVLATDLHIKEAQHLADKLRTCGTPALAMSKADLLDLPPVYRLDNIVANNAGFTVYSGGRSLSKQYKDVFLIVCAQVPGPGESGQKLVVVDLFVYLPWARFRLMEGGSAFPYSQPANIRSAISQMLHFGGHLPVNRGVRTLINGGDWSPMALGSVEEFDRYAYWLIQVVNGKNRKLY